MKRIGRQATNLDGTDLIIDEIHGCCYIPFRKFLIVIRHTSDEEIQFDTMVFDLQQQQQQHAVIILKVSNRSSKHEKR